MKSQPWTEETLRQQDVIVISTNHKAFDLQELANSADLVIDTRNALKDIQGLATVVKA